ncbi:thiamine pyrophosphate-dependent enzyme [Amycolatopsis sp. NPDC003865]
MAVLTRPASSQDTLLAMYTAMVKTRMCETAVLRRLDTAVHPIAYRPVRGQEAVAAGTVAALAPGDRLVTTKRCLHELIACGMPLRDVIGMLLTPWTPAVADPIARAHGVIFSAEAPGAGLPVAAGAALAAKATASGRVTVVSFGDGAVNTGAFHEGANLAAAHRLPLVLLCRNEIFDGATTGPIAARAQGYGMTGLTVDGSDPVKVRRAVSEAIARARDGGGPTFVECVTLRLTDGHASGDDPLHRYEQRLTKIGADAAQLVRISAKAMSEVERLTDVLKLITGQTTPGGRR